MVETRRARLLVPTMPIWGSEKGARIWGRRVWGQKTWSSQRIVMGVLTYDISTYHYMP